MNTSRSTSHKTIVTTQMPDSVGLVVEALRNQGEHPPFHRQHLRKLKKEWPTLYEALQALIDDYDDYYACSLRYQASTTETRAKA